MSQHSTIPGRGSTIRRLIGASARSEAGTPAASAGARARRSTRLLSRRATAGVLTGVVVTVAAQVGGVGVAAAATPTIQAVGTLVTDTKQPSAPQETVPVSPAAAGNLLAVAVETKFPGVPSFTVSSMSGGGVTTWTKAYAFLTQDNVYGQELWWGTVTQPGASTLTVNYSSGATNTSSESATSVDVQEFSSSAGATTAWTIDQTGKVDSSTASTTPAYPTLTPASSTTADAYYGYMAVPGSVDPGTTPGVVYQYDARYNQVVYDTTVSGPTGPTASAPAPGTTWASIGMLVTAAAGATPPPPPPATSDRLTAGQQLATGQSLTSPNGSYQLVMQTDGNLVVYAPGQRPLWNSHTWGHSGAHVAMQADGNVVVYDGAGNVLWHADTWGNSGATLVLQDDGNLVLYSSSGSPLWFTGWDRGAGAANDTMVPGEQLTAGQTLTSANGQYTLVMQSDGNVVEYASNGQALWNTGTWGRSGIRLKQQFDGNLVAYNPSRQAVWNAGTWNRPNDHVIVQNDGNVVIYASGGGALWSSRYGRTY